MPQQVRAVVVDPAAPGRLTIKPVELREPDRDEVAVRVTADCSTAVRRGASALPRHWLVSEAGN